jgi:predicted helicase
MFTSLTRSPGQAPLLPACYKADLSAGKSWPYKFQNEIHANEIVLLAYYIAAINIEQVYHGEVHCGR